MLPNKRERGWEKPASHRCAQESVSTKQTQTRLFLTSMWQVMKNIFIASVKQLFSARRPFPCRAEIQYSGKTGPGQKKTQRWEGSRSLVAFLHSVIVDSFCSGGSEVPLVNFACVFGISLLLCLHIGWRMPAPEHYSFERVENNGQSLGESIRARICYPWQALRLSLYSGTRRFFFFFGSET